ncbi:unnamed protein product [Rotaria socialis]
MYCNYVHQKEPTTNASLRCRPIFSHLLITLSQVYLFKNLSGNKITDGGAKELADALRQNRTLTTLHLSGNDIRYEGAKEIADTTRENKTLTTVYFDRNPIGREGWKRLSNAMREKQVRF